MRKRISCKIIKSVPFDSGDNRLRQRCNVKMQQPKINDIGTSSYTSRLLVTTTSIDENATAQFLDCRA